MRPVFCAMGVAAVLAAAGCGGDQRATVKGKVTVAGKGPLPGGVIQFVDVKNPARAGSGPIAADGSYVLHEAPVGECKVVIDNSGLNPANKKTGTMPGMGTSMNMRGMPVGAGAPGTSGPKPGDKAKMGAAPKGADIPTEMNEDKGDFSNQKYVPIDGNLGKLETTPLTFTVVGGENNKDFDVK